MPKSEGSCSKDVGQGGVDGGVVLVVVPVGDREDVQLGHVLSSQNNWQPLIVRCVLQIIGCNA